MTLKRILPYFELLHIYAAVAVFATTVMFSLLAYGGVPDLLTLIRVVGTVSLAQACVGITNELIDLPRDRQVKPDRPLVSGKANPTIARTIAWSAAIGSLILGMSFGWVEFVFVIMGLGSGLVYNFWLKGTPFSWLPYVTGFSLLPVWPFVALNSWNAALLWIWLPALPGSIALNISQSLSDVEEDQELGFGGITKRLGLKWSLIVLWGMCGLTILFAFATAAMVYMTPILIIALVVAVGLTLFAMWRSYTRPGNDTWQLVWYLVVIIMGTLAIGWFNAVL